MKIIYEWLKRGRHAFLRRVELFSQEDLAKKPPMPECSSAVERLKAASDRAHNKRLNIIEKLRGRNGKGH